VVLEDNAAAVTLFHNHASGVADPSRADELITQGLRDSLALLDMRILDHLIIGASAEYWSG
jgi:DNA repair protein RadC